MELIDSRRLTGPNLVWDHPGALLEVAFRPENAAVVERWKAEVLALLDAVGLPKLNTAVKSRHGGAWLVIGGPIDQLYALTELNELAWSRASGTPTEEDITTDSLRENLRAEANPPLIALQQAALENNVSFLWDEDAVSLGMGVGSKTWLIADLPDSSTLAWTTFSDIPVAVITGTNGKSTNVRLLGHMAKCAGRMFGTTSTDWIRVGDDVLDSGDYSGPGGARTLLRDERVEIAFLETARGGLLRRGTGVNRADVALITNVAEDHMGQYGIQTVRDLVEAKMVVSRLVKDGGVLVLNADDPPLVAYSTLLENTRLCWFSRDAKNPVVLSHLEAGGTAYFEQEDAIIQMKSGVRTEIASIPAIPLTLRGLASYNISNCLSATAVALELGIPLAAVQQGLVSFESTPDSNPGRSNYFAVRDFTVLLDYAHNVHSLTAILETTAKLNANRRILTLSTAGDRTEHEIREMARIAAESGVEEILITDCVGYERELGKGGVPRILLDELRRHGKLSKSFESEFEGVKEAFRLAKAGDLLILLVKAERVETLQLIQQTNDGVSI